MKQVSGNCGKKNFQLIVVHRFNEEFFIIREEKE
jgi:hypothetical protein